MILKRKKNKKGFTLVEMLVSVSIFTVIMLISMGAILSVFDANKKSQTLRTVMDNMNFTLEAMTRVIRFGTVYHCDANQGNIALPRDCVSGATSMAILDSNGRQIVYKLINSRITMSVNGGADYYLTSSDVTIQNLIFRVFGSPTYSNGSDLYQPQVIIVVSGFAGIKPTSKSSFDLQTTVSQRMFDSQ